MADAARALVQAIPNARYSELKGQTHDIDPVVLAPVLVQFFNQ